MFGDPFYHKSTRRAAIAFGVLFDNIFIVRENQAEQEQNRLKVPLGYHDKKAWHQILRQFSDRNEETTSIQGYFPKMGYEISDIAPIRETQVASNQYVYETSSDGTTKRYLYSSKYRLTFQLTIVTKNQTDMYKILEQILPYFSPSISVSLKPSRHLDVVNDMVFTLDDISKDDELEGQMENLNLQLVTRYLTFTTDIPYYGPIETANGIIKTANVRFIDGNSGKGLSQINIEIDPADADGSSFGISCGTVLLDDDFNIITSASLGTSSGLLC